LEIRIYGTPKNGSRQLVRDAAAFFISKRIHKSIFQHLKIYITFNRKMAAGEAWMDCKFKEPTKYIISIHPDLSLFHLLLYLAHECVHVEQYSKGWLKDIVNTRSHTVSKAAIWRGKPVFGDFENDNKAYTNAPWEVHARKGATSLKRAFIAHRKKIGVPIS
jgi:hypothetical protein